jgi:hypothetical protein
MVRALAWRASSAEDYCLVIVVSVPAPLAALAILFLRTSLAGLLLRVATLLGARAAATSLFLVDLRGGDRKARATKAAGPTAEATRTRRTTRTARTARRAAESTWTRTRRRTGIARLTLLRLLDEDVASVEHRSVPLLDRRFGIRIGGDFDESEAARTLRFPVQRDAHALDGSSLLAESIPKLYFSDRVRQIPHEQLGTHSPIALLPPIRSHRVTIVPTLRARATKGKRELPRRLLNKSRARDVSLS